MQVEWVMASISQIGIAARMALPGVIYPWLAADPWQPLAGYQLKGVMFMSFPTIDRIVTGHDENGKAIVSSQGRLPTVVEIAAVPGMVFHEVWSTAGSPAAIDNGIDPTLQPLRLLPPKTGTRVRLVDFPPETPDVLVRGSEKSEDAFAEIGDVAASLTVKADSPHPLMHRTQTVDYGIVIGGEITLVLDDSEVSLSSGAKAWP
jgi:hypothetical protein